MPVTDGLHDAVYRESYSVFPPQMTGVFSVDRDGSRVWAIDLP